MTKAMLPGSFDPFTLGHLDIVKRCSKIFDEVVIVIGRNSQKNYLLSVENRVKYIEDAIKDLDNVTCEIWDGIVADFAAENKINVIVKGVRNSTDLDYENIMTFVNRDIANEKYSKALETFYLPCRPEYSNISSSVVRKLLQLDISVDKYVHNEVFLKNLYSHSELQ